MKVTEKKAGEGRVRLDAVASPAEVNHAFKVAEQSFAQQAGLRPVSGKTVAQAAEEQLGIKDLDSIIRKDALEFLAPFAIDKRNLVPAYPSAPSSTEVLQRNKPFEFTQVVTLKPDYELDSYDPVSLVVPSLDIDPSEVEAQIARILDNYADYEPADPRPVQQGDAMDVALSVSQGGKPLDALNTDNRLYIMGMGFMPPSFDENVLGMNVGETKTFSFVLPGAESEDEFECTVTINEMKRKKVPELTDEWVASHFPMYPSAEAMREFVETGMADELRRQRDELMTTMAAAEIAKRFHGKIDDAVYEAMRKTLLENMQLNVTAQGVSMNDFIQSQGGEQQFGMMLMLQTRQMLVQGYALDAVFRHEKMELTDEDVMAAAASINPQNPAAGKRSMEEMGRGFALREMAARTKANKWLVENAIVSEVDPESQGDEPTD